jgi:dynein heavy chain
MQQIQQAENPQADINALSLYNKFIERIRIHLHIVLAFSPVGDSFRNRLRMFPALINCCTIDWFKVCAFEDESFFKLF